MTPISDDVFRLLAIPFGGPIPSPHSPRGVDIDGEFFDEDSDVRLNGRIPRSMPVDWHHRKDAKLGPSAIGTATYDGMDDEGHWQIVRLDPRSEYHRLIRKLAERGAVIFGSSESTPGQPLFDRATGHIIRWPWTGQTLSTSPQNTLSVIRRLRP